MKVFFTVLQKVSGKLCPEDAWGELKNVTYEPLGIVEQVNPTLVYIQKLKKD